MKGIETDCVLNIIRIHLISYYEKRKGFEIYLYSHRKEYYVVKFRECDIVKSERLNIGHHLGLDVLAGAFPCPNCNILKPLKQRKENFIKTR